MTNAERARELLDGIMPYVHERDVERLTAALDARERETWDAAIAVAERYILGDPSTVDALRAARDGEAAAGSEGT